jgi:hypothetical protein
MPFFIEKNYHKIILDIAHPTINLKPILINNHD